MARQSKVLQKKKRQLQAILMEALIEDKPKVKIGSEKHTGSGYKIREPMQLMRKVLNKIDKDLDSEDEDLRHKAIDKVIKFLPYVMPKEKTGPLIQVNQQKNLIIGTNSKKAVLAIDDYLKIRQKRMDVRDAIENGKTTPIEIEGDIDGGNENKISAASPVPDEQRNATLTEAEIETPRGIEIEESED